MTTPKLTNRDNTELKVTADTITTAFHNDLSLVQLLKDEEQWFVGGTSEKSAPEPTGECTLTDVMIQLCKAEGFPQITARKKRKRK